MSKKRTLGKNGPEVSALGFGAMGMSDFYGVPPSEEDNIKTLNYAIDIGCNFIDTANVYGVDGANERLIGKVLATRRSEVFICTKFGILRDSEGAWKGVGSKAEQVKEACAASLARLGVEYIDLYYQHRVDPDTPIEETVGAMAELVKEGKVRYLGLSEASAETIRRAHAVHPITAYQVEYSPWTTDIERDARLTTCRELGIAIVAYSPLGRGFLTGNLTSRQDLSPDDWRLSQPRFTEEAFAANQAIVAKLASIASAKGVTTAQLTLAWLMAQGDDVIPIPGTTKISRLQENWASVDIVLTPEEVQSVRALVDSASIVGDRYNERGMNGVNI